MSIEISRRFEGPPQPRSAAYLMQCERIKKDEEISNKIAQLKLENEINERASWNEELEEKCQYKRLRETNKQMNEELRMATKAIVEVRRVALRKLLESEKQQYEKELISEGKAFYKQRI